MKHLITASLAALAVGGVAHAQHWSYEGDHGPARWGEIDEGWAACSAGTQQSPIDLAGAHGSHNHLNAINWASSVTADVIDNGHTIQANVENAGSIDLGGTEFAMLQFHFHNESEHTIDGEFAPLEVHFVHAAEDGRLAVIGVMLVEGESSDTLGAVWDGLGGEAAFDPSGLLPSEHTTYRYEGSLTTPPCSEIVSWIVMTEPVTVSAEQIAWFVERHPGSNRPIQDRNRRYILR